MASRNLTHAEETLNELQAKVIAWRQTREPYARLPQKLWAEATELAEELGVSLVQETLGLNRASLLRRMEQLEQEQCEPIAFVELSPEPPRSSSSGRVIELEDARGLRLTLRLAAGDELSLAQVIDAFRGTR